MRHPTLCTICAQPEQPHSHMNHTFATRIDGHYTKINGQYVDTDYFTCHRSFPFSHGMAAATREFQRDLACQMLQRFDNNKTATARALGMTREGLYKLLKRTKPPQGNP